jgi:ribosomal-protein-alanine N-acetyltransferase
VHQKEGAEKMLSHRGTQEIETNRLLLRRFRYSDDDAMLKYWVSDPKIQSMYSEPVYTTKSEVKELLDKYISSYRKDDYYRWAIVEKESLACIGQIAIFLVDSKNHFCEIEYCIGSQFHRNGFASEATEAVVGFGFGQVNFHKIQVCHKENNIASQGVIKKCGFTYEGTLRDYFFMDGKYVDRLYYSMLKSEWEYTRFK